MRIAITDARAREGLSGLPRGRPAVMPAKLFRRPQSQVRSTGLDMTQNRRQSPSLIAFQQ
jgi:hypothetical protein